MDQNQSPQSVQHNLQQDENTKIIKKKSICDDNEINVSSSEESKENINQPINKTWIIIRGIDKFSDEISVYKLVNKITQEKAKIQSIFKQYKQPYALVNFFSEDDKILFEVMFKQCQLTQDSNQQKIKKLKIKPGYEPNKAKLIFSKEQILKKIEKIQNQRMQATEEDVKKQLEISLQERICPLWKTEYSEQIKLKRNQLKEMLENWKKTCTYQLVKDKNSYLPKWLDKETLPCPINEFIESDPQKLFNYRNKAEFTIGCDEKNQVKVGFNRGNFEKGVMLVESADQCPIVSKESIILADLLEKFIIENLFQYSVYNKVDHKGFWRYLTVRQSERTKQILIQVVVSNNEIQEQNLQKVKNDIKELFITKGSKLLGEYQIVSLGLQIANNVSDNIPLDGEIEILHGSSSYIEQILEKNFQIAANSFLQVNTDQCEKLYKLIGKIVRNTGSLDKNTIFLDICSGIGTIGISMADECNQIIGIEMVQSACQNAEQNILLNNVKNYKVVCAKVEDVIQDIVKPFAGKNKIIGVVDPPRAGLHKSVVKALRTCKGLDHLVFVACNPPAVIENLNELCLPENKKRRAPAFHPQFCCGVDLFPQTKHYEAIFYLRRYE